LATVSVVNFASKRKKTMMKDLVVGDSVLTASGTYKHVYAISHYHRTKMTEFIQIHTLPVNDDDNHQNNHPLEISPAHLLFLVNETYPVPAHDIRIGTILQSTNGPRLVTRLQMVQREGLYNPITTDGTIVVDDILASTYTTYTGTSHLHLSTKTTTNNPLRTTTTIYNLLSFHTIAHMAYTPYRVFCMILASSSSYHQNNSHSSNDEEEELATANQLMKSIYVLTWGNNNSMHLQLFVFVIYMIVFGGMFGMIQYNGVIALMALLTIIIIRIVPNNNNKKLAHKKIKFAPKKS